MHVRAPRTPRTTETGRHRRRPAAPVTGSPHATVVQLQRTAGNRAVASLLRPASVQQQRDHAPITDLVPKGTLDEAAWTATYRRAKAALDKGDAATAEPLYLQLLTDAATVAGLSVLEGFSPTKIHVFRGTAAPGLNLTLDRGDDPGHVAWVDTAGTFGVELDVAKGVPAVQPGLMISPGAFHADKAMSMRTIRHEMVHVRHKQITLEAIKGWHAAGRKPTFGAWVEKNAKGLRLSEADVVIVQKGARGGQVDTEVLAYVEGFMTEMSLSAPTKAGTAMAFFELLGAVETKKFQTWKQADEKVRKEAVARLRDHYGTLGAAHRERFKEWVAAGVARYAADTTGRKELFAALATFVR